MREGDDRRRVEGDPDAAVSDRRRGRGDGPDDEFQRRAACSPALRDRFRRQQRLPVPDHRPDRQPPAGVSSQPRSGGGRGLAPSGQLRLLLAKPRPGAGQPDRWRLLAYHRPGRIRHRGQPRLGARDLLACRPHAATAWRLRLPHLAARRGRQRRRGVGGRSSDEARRRATRGGLRGRVRLHRARSAAHGKCGGERRALGACRRRDRVPAAQRRALDRAADQAAARRRTRLIRPRRR